MINTRINKDLNVERLNHMIKENETLEELIQRYKCVRKSWGKADSFVKVIGSVITLLTGISIILLPAISGIVVILLATIESILGGTATLTGFTSVMISMRWTKRKKKEFRARIKLIEEYINNLYYYTQKVKEDETITIEEVKQFDNLLTEFNNKLLELKFK